MCLAQRLLPDNNSLAIFIAQLILVNLHINTTKHKLISKEKWRTKNFNMSGEINNRTKQTQKQNTNRYVPEMTFTWNPCSGSSPETPFVFHSCRL